MGGCSAINCSNNSRNKYRMFRFPRDSLRRKKWIVNCRRGNWIPGRNSVLCSIHFEESQFEQNRKDKWKKLKPNAIPTLFNIPKSTGLLTPNGFEGIVCPKPGPLLELHVPDMENIRFYSNQLKKKVEESVLPNSASSLFTNTLKYRKQGILQKQNEIEENSEVIISADHGYCKQDNSSAISNEDVRESIPMVHNISQCHAPMLLLINRDPEVTVSKDSAIISLSKNASTMANSAVHTVMPTLSKDIKTVIMSNIKAVLPTFSLKTGMPSSNMATVVSSPISNVPTIVLAPNNITSQVPSSTSRVVYALIPSSSTNSNIVVPPKNVNSSASSTTSTNTVVPSLSENIDKFPPSFMDTDITSTSEEVRFWKNKYKLALKKLRKALKEKESFEKKCKHLFRPDQIRFLEHAGSQPLSWSEETIQEALEICSACGRSGYSMLLSKGYPLPSERTLRRKTQQYRSEIDENELSS